MIEALCRILDEATSRGDPPAAACHVIDHGRSVHSSAHGTADGSVFDVASITKVVATTLACAKLFADGRAQLDEPVRARLPVFAHPEVTVRELLGHRSGLPPWHPFFADPSATRDRIVERAATSPLRKRGQRVYSDLGFIVLGAWIESLVGVRLDVYCQNDLWASIGVLDELGYAGSWLTDRVVPPTGMTRPREPAPGQEHLYRVPEQPRVPNAREVDDDNAFAMGGVAGHAGVFATASAVARVGEMFLRASSGESDPLAIGSVVRELMRADPADAGPSRGLGFDIAAKTGSSAGPLGRGALGAVGHLGFTGCSLWIDRDDEIVVALLSNRTLPGRSRVDGIRTLRVDAHRAVHDAVGSR